MYDLKNKTLYMFVGLPGAGKSTFAHEAVNSLGTACVLLSTDDYIEEVAEEQGITYDEAFQDNIKDAEHQLQVDLEEALRDDSIAAIMWDQTNLTPKTRKKKLARIPSNWNIMAVYFTCNEGERQRRLASRKGKTIPAHIDESMQNSLQEPTLSEGFHTIVSGDVFRVMFSQVSVAVEQFQNDNLSL
jgi:predicted kinase